MRFTFISLGDRDRVPLAEVDFSTAEERGRLNLFINECEGMCGV